MKAVTVGSCIVLTSEPEQTETIFGITVRSDVDCPHDTIFLIPPGSPKPDLALGRTVGIAPDYYVNPRQLGVIKNIKA